MVNLKSGFADHNPGIVNNDVSGSYPGFNGGKSVADGALIRDVHGKGVGTTTILSNLFGGFLDQGRSSRRQDDGCTALGQQLGKMTTQTARCSGDKGDFAIELKEVVCHRALHSITADSVVARSVTEGAVARHMRLAHVVMDSAEKAALLAQVVVTGVIEVLLVHMIANVVALRDMPLAPSDVHNPFCQSINRLFQACWVHGR